MVHRSIRVAALAACLGACATPSAQVMPRFGQLEVGGEIGVQQGSTVAARATVESLGLEQDDSVVGLRVDLQALGHWTFGFQESSHDGDGVADATLSQGGVTITAGTPVSSQFDVGIYQGAVTWDLLPGDTLELGLGVGLTALDVDAEISETTGGASVAGEELVPVPAVAGRVGFALGRLELSALLQWIDAQYSGNSLDFVDLDAMASVRILGDDDRLAGWIGAGWRYVDAGVAYEEDGDSVDTQIDFSGPWIGLLLSF